MGIYKPRPIHWVFCNKDSGALVLCSSNDDGTISETTVPGIEGFLVEVRVRLQKYKQASIQPALKMVFVLDDGENVYNLQFGLNTLVAKWGAYVILNDLLDVSRQFAFCLKKYPDSNTILPKWIQNGVTIVIPKETRDAFPRKKSIGSNLVIDWEKALGCDMETLVPSVNTYLRQKLESVQATTTNADLEPSETLEDDLVF